MFLAKSKRFWENPQKSKMFLRNNERRFADAKEEF